MQAEIYTGRVGKVREPLHMEYVRDLTPEDIIVRRATHVGSKAPALKNLRATHHRLAQALSRGMKEGDASLLTGYSLSRISVLKADPAFQELLTFYAGKSEEAYVDVEMRMAGVATDLVEELQSRLESKPETISNKDLNAFIKTTADRGGHSPIHKSETKTLVLDSSTLAAMKEEVQSKQNGQIRKVNHTEEAARVRSFVQGGSRAQISAIDSGSTQPLIEASEAQGISREGADI